MPMLIVILHPLPLWLFLTDKAIDLRTDSDSQSISPFSLLQNCRVLEADTAELVICYPEKMVRLVMLYSVSYSAMTLPSPLLPWYDRLTCGCENAAWVRRGKGCVCCWGRTPLSLLGPSVWHHLHMRQGWRPTAHIAHYNPVLYV
jgi:hypothetical protein